MRLGAELEPEYNKQNMTDAISEGRFWLMLAAAE